MKKLRWPLFSPGDRVLVAVSGGPDSLSLLHALYQGREAHGMAAVEAAHLDHGLRSEESAAEAQWVAAWCAERGIPCHLGQANVAAVAKARKRSRQEASRAARYEFLAATAAAVRANKIATAHTQDDQVETVLLNILRGTGLDGLRGIPTQRDLYVRPLLDVTRSQIEAYCLEHSLTPRRDLSNFSPDKYTRNRIRLELLPRLVRDYNPAVGNALLRLSEIAALDSDYRHQQAQAALPGVLREQDADRMVLNRAALTSLHPALLRGVLRLAIGRLRGTAEGMTYEMTEAICRAITSLGDYPLGLTLSEPLCRICVTKDVVTLTLPRVCDASAPASVPLPIPGRAVLPGTDWAVEAGGENRPGAVAFNADVIQGTVLTVRNWRTGDKIAPVGLGGHHKKVSDIFTDAKVPRAERQTIPIVTDDAGILWIVGHALAERAKVTEAATRRLFLTATCNEFAQGGKKHLPGE